MKYINCSAVKKFALELSEKQRAGKFKRVGTDFLTMIDEESRRMAQASMTDEPVIPLLSKEAKVLIIQSAERKLADAVKARVMAHPSLGKTLKA